MKSSILASLATFFLLFMPWWKKGELTDVSKPYLGEYVCIEATMSGKDCLDCFEYVYLELKDNETFCLTFREDGKKKQTVEGQYRYNDKKQTITMQIEKSRWAYKRNFPMKEGKIYISVPYGKKNLALVFEQK